MAIERFVIVSDSHGDCIHEGAKAELLDWMEGFKPKHRIHLGDWLEARCLRTNANKEDLHVSMTPDWVAAREFLEAYRPTAALTGNHDFRVWDKAESNDGRVASLCEMMSQTIEAFFKKIKCKLQPYDALEDKFNPITLGDYTLIHGYKASKYVAYQAGLIHGNCIMGHVHRLEVITTDRVDGARGICCPCLMDPRLAEYARRREAIYRWTVGWLWGTLNTKTGKLTVNHKEIDYHGR